MTKVGTNVAVIQYF